MTKKQTKQTKALNPTEDQALQKLSESQRPMVEEIRAWKRDNDRPHYIDKKDTGAYCAPEITGNHVVDFEISDAKFTKTFGVKSPDLACDLFREIATITDGMGGDVNRVNSALSLVDEIKPRDGLEAMLANQMVAIHELTMACAARALSKDQTINCAKLYLSEVNKLSRTFTAQIAALNKHRGKGQQKMTVEHVHVNEGGQAVIGEIQAGGKQPSRVKGCVK